MNEKALLKKQFKNGFEVASYHILMMNITFREWNQYYNMLKSAVKSGVVSPQDIAAFVCNLKSASVITITIPEHEEYLNKIADLIILEQAQIDLMEQGQTRR